MGKTELRRKETNKAMDNPVDLWHFPQPTTHTSLDCIILFVTTIVLDWPPIWWALPAPDPPISFYSAWPRLPGVVSLISWSRIYWLWMSWITSPRESSQQLFPVGVYILQRDHPSFILENILSSVKFRHQLPLSVCVLHLGPFLEKSWDFQTSTIPEWWLLICSQDPFLKMYLFSVYDSVI